jgi:hypothetical protein
MTGLLGTWTPAYQQVSSWLIWAMMGAFALWSRRQRSTKELVLAAVLMLVFLPGLGPGYSPAYVEWFLGLLVASYALCQDRLWRGVLLGAYAVAAATYVYEFGFFHSHGRFMYQFYPTDEMAALTDNLSTAWHQTLARLPLFAAYLAVLAAGSVVLTRRRS